MDFEIHRCARRCAATDRELQPGDVVYSVLTSEGNEVVRRDYCREAWSGAPENAIGWWQTLIPSPDAQKVHWAPHDVMLHYFLELEAHEDKQDLRYVLVLLMIRRRLLRLETTEKLDGGDETLVLFCPLNEIEYRVRVQTPTPEREKEIQNELGRILFR